MNWKRLTLLWPPRRPREELDMQEELKSLAQIAGPRELGNLTLAAENARETWGWTWQWTRAFGSTTGSAWTSILQSAAIRPR